MTLLLYQETQVKNALKIINSFDTKWRGSITSEVDQVKQSYLFRSIFGGAVLILITLRTSDGAVVETVLIVPPIVPFMMKIQASYRSCMNV